MHGWILGHLGAHCACCLHACAGSLTQPSRSLSRCAATLLLAALSAILLQQPNSIAAQQQPERRSRPNYSVRSVRENLRLAQRVNETPLTPESSSNNPSQFTPPDAAELPERRSAETSGTTAGADPTPATDSTSPREYRVPLRTPNLENIRLKADDGLISLVAREGSLSDIITLLAETQGLNVVTADPLAVPVSITLDRVKLEDALDAVLSVTGYTWSINKNIMFITSVANAGLVSPQTQGLRLEVVTLDYAMARDVNTAITGLLSPIGNSFIMSSSDAESRQSREVVAIQDLPNYLERIREYIAQVDIPPRQVLIEVHVLQVDLDSTNRNGVNLDQLFRRNGNLLMEFHTTGFAATAPQQAFTFRFSDGNLNALVEMLRTSTDAKTLASPRILALSGQLSRIQVGEQLGFRVTTTTETSTTQSVDFLDVGVVLEVTPRVSRDGRIMLSVRPEVSSGRVNADTGLPEEKTTELDTDVILCDNEGIVIGGLIQETDSDLRQGIARLSDLPYVGGLFRRKEATKNRKEIIMALVPRLVPYYPPYNEYANDKFLQSDTPLFVGPLERNFRPWEPRHPEHSLIPHGYHAHWWHEQPASDTIIDGYAPPAEAVEEIPPPNDKRSLQPPPDVIDQSIVPMETNESARDGQHTYSDMPDPPPIYTSRLPPVTPATDTKFTDSRRRFPTPSGSSPDRGARIGARVTGVREIH
jgi:type IV pilus assembly protein PilQ